MLQWRKLNETLRDMTEEEVLALLNEERAGLRRVAILERLHQRYSTLRTTRERLQLMKEAADAHTHATPRS